MIPYSPHQVLSFLDRNGPATMKTIREATQLARRTVYAALRKLIASGYVVERPYLRDARQSLYVPVVKAE